MQADPEENIKLTTLAYKWLLGLFDSLLHLLKQLISEERKRKKKLELIKLKAGDSEIGHLLL